MLNAIKSTLLLSCWKNVYFLKYLHYAFITNFSAFISLNFHLIHLNYCVIFWAYLLKYSFNISYSSEYPAFSFVVYLSLLVTTFTDLFQKNLAFERICLYISDRYRHEIWYLIRLGTSDEDSIVGNLPGYGLIQCEIRLTTEYVLGYDNKLCLSFHQAT